MASIANSVAVTCCDAQVDSFDAGSGVASAHVRVYSGTPPARVDAALSGNTLLAELVMANPSFGAAVDVPADNVAEATANAITDDSAADATGTATFARILDRDSVPKAQYTVSATGGGGELQFNTTSFVAGVLVQITSFKHRQSEG